MLCAKVPSSFYCCFSCVIITWLVRIRPPASSVLSVNNFIKICQVLIFTSSLKMRYNFVLFFRNYFVNVTFCNIHTKKMTRRVSRPPLSHPFLLRARFFMCGESSKTSNYYYLRTHTHKELDGRVDECKIYVPGW